MENSKIDYIPISQPSITQKEIDYVTDAVKSGWVSSLGTYVDKFEKMFSEYCDTKYGSAQMTAMTSTVLSPRLPNAQLKFH